MLQIERGIDRSNLYTNKAYLPQRKVCFILILKWRRWGLNKFIPLEKKNRVEA